MSSERILKYFEIDGITYKLVACEAVEAKQANKLSAAGVDDLVKNEDFLEGLLLATQDSPFIASLATQLLEYLAKNSTNNNISININIEDLQDESIDKLSKRIADRLGLMSVDFTNEDDSTTD